MITLQTDVRRLREDLDCPGCGYSLRGLAGDRVTCPECGARCDVAAMVASQWTGRWYRAPGYSRLLWPVASLEIGGLISVVAGAVRGSRDGPGVMLALLLFTLAVWALLMYGIAGDMRGRRAVHLALFAHLLLLGYHVGVIGFVAGIVMAITGRNGGLGIVMIAGCAAVTWACYRGEKAIARACIREHLMAAAVDEAAPLR